LFFADVMMRRGQPGDRARAAGEYEARLRDSPSDNLTCARLAGGAGEAWYQLEQH
jgi:hypothetical protein